MEILIFLLIIFFIRRIQPIIIIRIIILIVLLYSNLIYFMVGRYWFSYALVIVMLRGVLVLFTYIVSLIPNERFERYNLVYIFIFILFFIRIYLYNIFIDESYMSLRLWCLYIRIFNLFITSFLLRIIIIVVWLRYLGKGAIRID